MMIQVDEPFASGKKADPTTRMVVIHGTLASAHDTQNSSEGLWETYD